METWVCFWGAGQAAPSVCFLMLLSLAPLSSRGGRSMLNHCRPQQSAHCPSLWGGCWGRCTPITGHRLSHRCEELRAVRPLGLVSQIPIHPTNNSGRPGPRHRHRHMQSVPMFTSDCLPPQPPHCHQPVCPVCGNWWTVGANAAAAGGGALTSARKPWDRNPAQRWTLGPWSQCPGRPALSPHPCNPPTHHPRTLKTQKCKLVQNQAGSSSL